LHDDKFVWDEHKNKANSIKHKVSFEEASKVFKDENALFLDDKSHSQDEERFKLIGFSEKARLLMVCHFYRNDDSLIRIVSARKAEIHERVQYERGW